VWHEKGRYERAIADFSQAIKIDPTLEAAYINRGWALHEKREFAGFAADPEHATRIDAALDDPDPARSAR
jgi:hypothetical protein